MGILLEILYLIVTHGFYSHEFRIKFNIKIIKNDDQLPFSMIFIDLHPTMIDISRYQNRKILIQIHEIKYRYVNILQLYFGK